MTPMTLPDVRIETVRGSLEPGMAAAVRSLAATAAAVDGVAPLSEQPLLRLDGTTETDVVHLIARDDVGVVGYAQLDLGAPDASSELVVAPRARGRGIGTTLLARLDALVDAPRHLAVWAHGDLPAARALAAQANLVVVRELWQMSLDLTARPADAPGQGASVLPAGVQVRAFVPGRDEDAWLRLNARAFAHHPEQGRMTRTDLDAREHEPWFDPAGLLLAERDGQLLAAVWTKVHPTDGAEPAVGELYVVGVDPDAQSLGLGTALTALALDHLTDAGLRTAILYTEADNTAAVRTYTRAGFTRSAVDVMFGSGSAPSGTASSPTSGTIGR
ncbi:mycothiol synthase [Cellulomonas sp. WB94]|uniref:mycothiol synthase n=1 Tax=Cellulomonas sp. WB94 TaxID=2173174 RepID=UPI000D577C60|nr:mycothiol synthase [Cellulomonas sp. WB94]PVU82529.1 mycothiol synthase [Cellulomonas sp. WB94]